MPQIGRKWSNLAYRDLVPSALAPSAAANHNRTPPPCYGYHLTEFSTKFFKGVLYSTHSNTTKHHLSFAAFFIERRLCPRSFPPTAPRTSKS